MTHETATTRASMQVDGDARVAEDARLSTGVACAGSALVGARARVAGDVTATDAVRVEEGAAVDGAVTAGGAVEWHHTARARRLACDGPFLVDGHALAGALEASEGVAPLPDGGDSE